MRTFKKYASWAVVTGASSGIGQAIATALSQNRFNIVLVARTAPDLEKVAADLKTETKIVAADVCTVEGQNACFKATRDLDVGLFVHAAGVAHIGSFLATSQSTYASIVSINCATTVEMTRHFADRFQNKGGGGIILVSSGLGFAPVPFAAVYAAAKAFVVSFGEALAEELRPNNIDVLTVIPGATKTKMHAELSALVDMTKLPLPIGEPAVVAGAALRALGRKDRVVPGAMNTVIAKVMAAMPTGLVKKQMGNVIKNALKEPA
jgi:short-subunit dehydrogenase